MTIPETATLPAVDLLAGLDWSIVRPPDIESMMSVEDWEAFRASRLASRPPVLLTRPQYASLGTVDQRLYDIARSAWHSNLPKLSTPMTQAVMDEIRISLQVDMMTTGPGVRRGIIVSANSNHGKTTVVLEALAQHAELLTSLYARVGSGPRVRDRHIPIVAVTCPPKATIAKLCYRILDFYGMPYRKSESDGALGDKVRKCLQACGSKVLFIDEISRLNMLREDAQITFDFIRDIQDSSATVILAGVDIEHTGLLIEGQYLREDGDLKTQTEARFTRLPLPKFNQDGGAGMQAWVDHLSGVEDQLMLLDKYAGMLSIDHADWLFDATDCGVIGSLSHIVKHACVRAIERGRKTGTEVIDLEILQAVALDWAAEKRRLAALAAEQRGQQGDKPRKSSSGRKRSGDSVYDGRR